MDINFASVIELTNISNEDFTHHYAGQQFTVKAGEKKVFPGEIAHHLAKHLSRKILLSGDKSAVTYDGTDKTGGTGTPLWNQDSEDAMIKKILGVVTENEPEKKEDPIESVKRQIEELNRKFLQKEVTDNLKYENKAEVISKLQEANIKFDPKASKDDLSKLLVTPSNK